MRANQSRTRQAVIEEMRCQTRRNVYRMLDELQDVIDN